MLAKAEAEELDFELPAIVHEEMRRRERPLVRREAGVPYLPFPPSICTACTSRARLSERASAAKQAHCVLLSGDGSSGAPVLLAVS